MHELAYQVFVGMFGKWRSCRYSVQCHAVLMILNYFMGAEIITYRKMNWLNTVKH